MNETNQPGIPLKVIAKGRDLGRVLLAYMKFFDDAKAVAATPGKSDDEIFADAMKGATYRLYLLGVEDGMKEEA